MFSFIYLLKNLSLRVVIIYKPLELAQKKILVETALEFF